MPVLRGGRAGNVARGGLAFPAGRPVPSRPPPSPAGSADTARGGKTRGAPGRGGISTLVRWAAHEPLSAPAGQGCPRGGGGGGYCATEAGPLPAEEARRARREPPRSRGRPGRAAAAAGRPSPAGPGQLLGVVVRAADGRAEPGCRLGGQARATDRRRAGEGAPGEGLLQAGGAWRGGPRHVGHLPRGGDPIRPGPGGLPSVSALTPAGARSGGGGSSRQEGPLPQARRRGWESGQGRLGPLMRRGGSISRSARFPSKPESPRGPGPRYIRLLPRGRPRAAALRH